MGFFSDATNNVAAALFKKVVNGFISDYGIVNTLEIQDNSVVANVQFRGIENSIDLSIISISLPESCDSITVGQFSSNVPIVDYLLNKQANRPFGIRDQKIVLALKSVRPLLVKTKLLS